MAALWPSPDKVSKSGVRANLRPHFCAAALHVRPAIIAQAGAAHNNMRILHYLNFATGGITRYTGEVLRAMSPEMECHVICPPAAELRATGAEIHPDLVSLRHPSTLGRKLLFLCSQFRNPARLIARAQLLRPDILHFGDFTHLTYRHWGPKLRALQIPFAISVHDVTRPNAMLNRQWENLQLVHLYRDAAVLFVHSKAQKLQLATFAGVAPSKIKVVPHGVYGYPENGHSNDVRKELGIPLDASVGLFFGSIRDDKGLQKLISAVAELPDTHLIVAGQVTSRTQRPVAHYRRLAQALKAESRAHFVDSFIPDERVGDYFRAADWCGLAYDKNFTSQSGVLCSAINYQTPVLVASAPTLLETVAKYRVGIAAADDSVKALVAAMQCLHLNRGPDVFEFEKYCWECSWGKNAELTTKAYREILALKN
jgi:glycosyltransferase involved in cell wall biosynthesis